MKKKTIYTLPVPIGSEETKYPFRAVDALRKKFGDNVIHVGGE